MRKPQPAPSSSYQVTLDDFVTPHKLFLYDLKSAREVVGKTVWVRSGNRLPYFPYANGSHRVDLAHKSGLLPPLERLEVKDVIVQTVQGQKQVMAVFSKPGEPVEYAVTEGKVTGGNYDFFINDVFFIDDPHLLYNHWPADVWEAIEHHKAKSGMNELQVSFALGTNVRVSGGDYGNRTVQYIEGDSSTMVEFSGNKAVSIEPGSKP